MKLRVIREWGPAAAAIVISVVFLSITVIGVVTMTLSGEITWPSWILSTHHEESVLVSNPGGDPAAVARIAERVLVQNETEFGRFSDLMDGPEELDIDGLVSVSRALATNGQRLVEIAGESQVVNVEAREIGKATAVVGEAMLSLAKAYETGSMSALARALVVADSAFQLYESVVYVD